MAVKVFVDSGADLRGDLAISTDIVVVPLSIHFGEAVYKDSVDLMPADFYRLLVTSSELPNTSQPSPGDFITAYSAYSAPGDTIFSFHLSAKLSGTYQSAVIAARQMADRDIRVIDTHSASLGVALPAIMARRWAGQSVSVEQIQQRVDVMLQSHSLYFLVDTLDYLQRHGRIGKAQALVGGLLNIKPVLTLEDGQVTPAEKVRGQNRAMTRLVELVKAKVPPNQKLLCAIVDAQVPDVGAQLQASMASAYPQAEFFRATLGPTIGTHTGPGTVGIIIAAIPAD